MSVAREVLSFLRLAFTKGWRPMWRVGMSGFGLSAVALCVLFASVDPLWLLVALLAVLLVGAYFAFADESERARTNEHNAARTDLLEKLNQDLALKYRVSQEQYKVFEGWER
jgi:hypothetical protein